MRRHDEKPGLGQVILSPNPDLWGPLWILKCMYPWLAIDVPDLLPEVNAEHVQRAADPKAGRRKA